MEIGEMAERLRSGMTKMEPQLRELGVIFGELSVQIGEFSTVLASFVDKESHVARCKHPDCGFASLPY